MSFAEINYLFIIWAVPFILLFFLYGSRRRKRILNLFAGIRGQAAIVPQNLSLRRWIKAALILGAVLFIALALAGPQYGYVWEEIEQEGVDLVIVLDCSRSMLADDIQPNRLERAKREIYDLLALLKGDRAGLVAFAGTAFLQCPLTLDHSAFHLFLNALTPDYLPVGGTNLAEAVDKAVSAFDPKSSAEKAIILITDGEHTGRGNPAAAARKAADAGIKLFCIGVGGAEGVPLRRENGGFVKDASGRIVLSKLDEETLKTMADIGKGIYVRSVAGDMDLETIYVQEIRGKMEAVAQAGGRRQIHQNRYQWPLFLAVLLLLAERCISVVRRAPSPIVVVLAVLLAVPAAGRANELQEGMNAYEKGAYDQAIDHFAAAQLKNPSQPELLYNLGNAYYKKGDYDAAEGQLRDALNLADPALKAKIYYNLGNIDFRKGRMKEAIENYQKALELQPDDREAKENIEFVEKVMAQKPPSSRNQSGQDEKKDEENTQQGSKGDSDSDVQSSEKGQDEDQKDQSSSQGESNDNENSAEDAPRPSSGEIESEEQQNSAASAGSQEPEGQKPQEQPAAAEEKEAPAGDADAKQLQRMLDRLKDQPGKATMPAYGDTPVEKDW